MPDARCTRGLACKRQNENRLVAVTERSTIASETVTLTFDTSETAVTALRAV